MKALPALFVAALLAGCMDGEGDVERNERILADLPAPPGARRLELESAPYFEEGGETPQGYTTTALYVAPSGASDSEVVAFYAARLRGWHCRREQVGALLLHCTRNSALISINTENMHADPPRFEVVADHEGARPATSGVAIATAKSCEDGSSSTGGGAACSSAAP